MVSDNPGFLVQNQMVYLSAAAVVAVITLCGAVVLLLLDIWLRRKAIKDPTVIWLTVSLLSWCLCRCIQLLPKEFSPLWVTHSKEHIRYIFSPVSSILFTVAAFRLSRVREIFRREDLQMWPKFVTSAVAGLSLLALLLPNSKDQPVGDIVDATASSIGLIVLAGGLLYSFYKYGNQLLAGLTGLTFTFLVAYQFIEAFSRAQNGVLAAMNIAGITLLTMLFISLGVAWGLSETSRLRIVGTPTQVTVIVMFVDLRGSTQWTRSVISGDYQYAGTFMDQLRSWIWRKADEAIPARPNLVKFLGDGFMFVWETPQDANKIEERTRAAASLACILTQEYFLWTRSNSALWKEVPQSIGIGIDIGSAIRLTFENGSEDYLGEPVNNAAKMQDMARPSGGVVIRDEVWKKFAQDDPLQQQFPQRGEMRLGGSAFLPVHATQEVEFLNCYAAIITSNLTSVETRKETVQEGRDK